MPIYYNNNYFNYIISFSPITPHSTSSPACKCIRMVQANMQRERKRFFLTCELLERHNSKFTSLLSSSVLLLACICSAISCIRHPNTSRPLTLKIFFCYFNRALILHMSTLQNTLSKQSPICNPFNCSRVSSIKLTNGYGSHEDLLSFMPNPFAPFSTQINLRFTLSSSHPLEDVVEEIFSLLSSIIVIIILNPHVRVCVGNQKAFKRL